MDIYGEIFEKAKLLMKDEPSEREEGALYEMCLCAYSELFSRLREDISVNEIYEQFVRAAAALALSMYVGIDSSQVESYCAGSLSVKRRSLQAARDSALSLRRQAELMLSGYLREQSFNFRTVRS